MTAPGEKGNGAVEGTKPGTGGKEAGDRRWPRARAEPERGPETRGVGGTLEQSPVALDGF